MIHFLRGCGAVLVTAVVVGCGGPGQRNSDFVPTEDAARSALEAYLRAWTQGDTNPTIAGTHPTVAVSDTLRTGGRTLVRYEILGAVPADAPRCFAVRLTLDRPAADLRERYVVVGLDPIWVWRYEDYVMITHWEHRMPTAKAAAVPVSP